MHSFFQSFKELPWGSIVSYSIGILGIVSSVYFYVKSQREKTPYYSFKTTSLVRNDLSKLKNIEIKYKSRNVTELSMTKFAFWNGGKGPIRKEDITTKDPLLITNSNKNLIYDVEVIFNKNANNFTAELINDQTIALNFDYLNYNDGATINIFHSGDWGQDLKISGSLIGSNKIEYGIKKNNIQDKLLKSFFFPVEFIDNNLGSKYRIFKWIAIPVAVLTIVLLFPFLFIIYPFNFIYNKLHLTPKEFTFEI